MRIVFVCSNYMVAQFKIPGQFTVNVEPNAISKLKKN